MTGAAPLLPACALLLLTACGVQPQEAPEPVPVDRLPSAAAPRSPAAAQSRGRVWSARGERLSPVTVDLPAADVATRVRVLLALAGPTEQPPSALPDATRLLGVRQDDDLLELRLSADVARVPGRRLPLALGQLVLTVTEDPSVRQVVVRAPDRALRLLDVSGAPVQRPLVRADFAGLLSAG